MTDGYSTTIVPGPYGDTVLIDGIETYPHFAPEQLRINAGTKDRMNKHIANQLTDMLLVGLEQGWVEIPVAWSKNTGWKFDYA